MAGKAGSGNRACGHPAPPGARFCPDCGAPATSAAPSQPLTAPLPAVPAPPSSAWPPPESPPGAWPPRESGPAAWPPAESPAAAPPPRPEPDPWDSWYAPRRQPSPPSDPEPPPWSASPDPQSWAAPSGQQSWPAPPGGAQPPFSDADADSLLLSSDSPTDLLDRLRSASGPRGPSGPRRPVRPLVLVMVAAAIVAVVAGVFIVQSLSGGSPASGTTGSTPSATSPDARRQAATRLSGLLAQSGTDRAAVTGAAVDVRACGPSLRQDARIFSRAASSRRQLLSRLASMPGRSALPAALLQDLTSAWQASAEVDSDLAQWAQDNITRGCHHHHGRSDAHLRASSVPEGRATVAKRAFAAAWNPIARQYGLTTYQRSQL